MNAHLHIVLLTIVMILAVVYPIVIFTSRRRIYEVWAKGSSILVCLTGFAWSVLGFLLLHLSSSLSCPAYLTLGRVKTLLGGLCIGLGLSILISRPYKKVAREASKKI
jgi:hypothetical protein